MTLRNLPKVNALQRPKGCDWDAPSDAFAKWAELPLAAADNEPATISIFEVIGEDYWTGGGFTAKRMASALRVIGKVDVKVKINSPGGDMFEGIAIYNLLRDHPAKVTIEVLGYAASAASTIVMAGDDIAMGPGSMLMIHKAWGLVVGNDDDFRAAAELFGKFNESMVEIYAARTGLKSDEIVAMLAGPAKGSDGTWMTATEAVAKGFADRLIDDVAETASARAELPSHVAARRRTEAAMAKDGIPRSERAAILNSLAGPRDATHQATAARDAGQTSDDALSAQLRKLFATTQSMNVKG